MSRRTNLDIIADILKSLYNERGQLIPTHVMYKANLSHKLLKEYLADLTTRQLISFAEEEGKRIIKITDRGIDFLKQFDRLKTFKDTFGI